MRVGVFALSLPVLLLGCALRGPSQDVLALKCVFQACVCAEENRVLFSKRKQTDVLWNDRGNAYCPEKFRLELEKSQGTPYAQ